MLEVTPTRSVYLDLQEERTGMQEGYRFLDEKRLVLAAELLKELKHYDSVMNEYRLLTSQAAGSLKESVARHGLNGLGLYPSNRHAWSDIQSQSRSVLGVNVQQISIEEMQSEVTEFAINASPEAEKTKQEFTRLITLATSLAAVTANLVRLENEYQKTSRRARALEDVLLPEIDQTLAQIDTALEDMDKEEVVRVHFSLRP